MEVISEPVVLPGRAFQSQSRRGASRSSNSRSDSTRTSLKPRRLPRQLESINVLYNASRDLFYQSPLAENLQTMLNAKNRPRVNKAVSLGLGSLGTTKDQSRRIKQLVIFVAIASALQEASETNEPFPIYAQDPTFTKADEEFLEFLGVKILRTTSPSDLGETGDMIDEETLIYSPFLTLDAYGQLFDPAKNASLRSLSSQNISPVLIGDDWNALKLKWEKKTTEHRDVETFMKTLKARNYQRRVVSGSGFWEESDNPFPMALYWRLNQDKAQGSRKSKESR